MNEGTVASVPKRGAGLGVSPPKVELSVDDGCENENPCAGGTEKSDPCPTGGVSSFFVLVPKKFGIEVADGGSEVGVVRGGASTNGALLPNRFEGAVSLFIAPNAENKPDPGAGVSVVFFSLSPSHKGFSTSFTGSGCVTAGLKETGNANGEG